MMASSQSSQRSDPRRGAVALAAGLREIEAGDDAEPRRQALQEHRHEVGEHDD